MRKLWIIGLATAMSGFTACAAHGQALQGAPPPGTPGGPDDAGRLFISPMGEPFRMRQPDRIWFDNADTNHDGALSPEEFRADAARFFAVLDRKHDGEIDPDDMDYYERFLCPEVRVASSGGRRPDDQGMRSNGNGGFSFRSGGTAPRQGRQGAARFAYLDYPQPVVVADRNFNRGVDSDEFARAADDRFATLDKNGDGRITHNELPPLGADRGGRPGQPGGPGRRTIGG